MTPPKLKSGCVYQPICVDFPSNLRNVVLNMIKKNDGMFEERNGRIYYTNSAALTRNVLQEITVSEHAGQIQILMLCTSTLATDKATGKSKKKIRYNAAELEYYYHFGKQSNSNPNKGNIQQHQQCSQKKALDYKAAVKGVDDSGLPLALCKDSIEHYLQWV